MAQGTKGTGSFRKSIRLSSSITDKLETLAKNESVTISDIIRRIVSDNVGVEVSVPKQRFVQKETETSYEKCESEDCENLASFHTVKLVPEYNGQITNKAKPIWTRTIRNVCHVCNSTLSQTN